jgi:hypothetical protein
MQTLSVLDSCPRGRVMGVIATERRALDHRRKGIAALRQFRCSRPGAIPLGDHPRSRAGLAHEEDTEVGSGFSNGREHVRHAVIQILHRMILEWAGCVHLVPYKGRYRILPIRVQASLASRFLIV